MLRQDGKLQSEMRSSGLRLSGRLIEMARSSPPAEQGWDAQAKELVYLQ